MIKNNKYWNSFYKKNTNLVKESGFAKFIYRNKKKFKFNSIIDCGCGSGMDSFFFYKKKIKVVAIDNCAEVKNIFSTYKFKNILFQQFNFKNNKKLSIVKKTLLKIKQPSIYARFFLHSIDEKTENYFLNFSKKLLKKNSYLFLEFRNSQDAKIKKYFKNHQRRFINTEALKKKIIQNNFTITYEKVSDKFSIFGFEKPMITRIVAKKC